MTTLIASPERGSHIRAVIDTNVLISAALFGLQAEYALHLVQERRMIGVTSELILAETDDKLREKFQRSVSERAQLLTYLRTIFELVVPAAVSVPTLRDPDDLVILGTAVAADANLIITSDRDLLTLGQYERIGIVHPKTLQWLFPKR